MKFAFYPNHEYGCPHVGHCPHLGGAALGTLVLAASEQSEFRRFLHGTLDEERRRNSALWEENQRLKQQLEQVKLELKLERQNKFATSRQRRDENSESVDPSSSQAARRPGKKRGAPVGHPGWYRPTPTEYDWAVEVASPRRCVHCQGCVTVDARCEPREHLQEDVIDGTYRVVCYLHPVASCDRCGAVVEQPGAGEILGSRIGPRLRSMAVYLRNVIGVSYRKVPRIIQEMFGIAFTPAALIGFERMLADQAEPVAEDVAKKLGSSDGAVHADETYWTLNGARAYYWVHGDEKLIHFQFDTSRSGQVSRNVLGDRFTGTLVTDCYSGYHAHAAGAKQKCLAHVARTARDWQKLVESGTPDDRFFENVRQFVKRGCDFSRRRRGRKTGQNGSVENLDEHKNHDVVHECHQPQVAALAPVVAAAY